jgi:Tfp pilus assembly protein PilZ
MVTDDHGAVRPSAVPAGEATDDRRSAPRLRFTLKVRLTSADLALSGYSADVSATGIFLETASPVPAGTRVILDFEVSAASGRLPVRVRSVVARCTAPGGDPAAGGLPGLGIRFEEFLLGEKSLQSFVRERAAEMQAPLAPGSGKLKPAAKRFAAGFPVYWGRDGGYDHEGTLFNLSTSGALIETGNPPQPGESVGLWFELPVAGLPTRVEVEAKVIRVTKDARSRSTGMGVAFQGSGSAREALRMFTQGRADHDMALAREAWRYALENPMGTGEVSIETSSNAEFSWLRVLTAGAVGAASLLLLFVISRGLIALLSLP